MIGITVLAAVTWQQKVSRELPLLLQRRAEQAGFVLDFGNVQRGWFSSTARQARLHFGSGISVTAKNVRFSRPLFGEATVAVDGVHFVFRGSPTALFEELGKKPKWYGFPIAFNNVSVDYEDRLFGRVALKDVIVNRIDSGYLVRAGELSLGSKRWKAVTLSIEKTRVTLKIGIGEQIADSAQIQLMHIPTDGVASEWVLNLASQPLAPLIKRIGVDPGMAFDASRIVGTISIIVPDDPQRRIRGTLSLLVDGCPKPTWTDSKALIGNTGSLGARVEPAADRSSWDLPHVEVAFPLFSLVGTGRITLGEHPRFSIDVLGGRNCAQLRAHLPPSEYLELVKSSVDTNSANVAVKQSVDLAPDSAELRLQIDLDDLPQGRRNIAWHLTSGCGLKELSQGAFADLTLPRAHEGRSALGATNETPLH